MPPLECPSEPETEWKGFQRSMTRKKWKETATFFSHTSFPVTQSVTQDDDQADDDDENNTEGRKEGRQ